MYSVLVGSNIESDIIWKRIVKLGLTDHSLDNLQDKQMH